MPPGDDPALGETPLPVKVATRSGHISVNEDTFVAVSQPRIVGIPINHVGNWVLPPSIPQVCRGVGDLIRDPPTLHVFIHHLHQGGGSEHVARGRCAVIYVLRCCDLCIRSVIYVLDL